MSRLGVSLGSGRLPRVSIFARRRNRQTKANSGSAVDRGSGLAPCSTRTCRMPMSDGAWGGLGRSHIDFLRWIESHLGCNGKAFKKTLLIYIF